VPGYTNTYSQSQNTHTKPEQEQSSSPQLDEKYTSLQRRKMLASTIQFSHTTPSRHKHHHSDIRIYPGHKDNHPHTSVRAPCAAPDTQQRTNASDKNRLIASHVRHPHHESCASPGGISPPGCVSTWTFSTTYGSAAPHTDTQQPNPTPSTGNYLTMRGQ